MPQSVQLFATQDSPGQNSGMGSLSLLQGILPTQGLNPGLPHCRWILYQLSHQGSPPDSWACTISTSPAGPHSLWWGCKEAPLWLFSSSRLWLSCQCFLLKNMIRTTVKSLRNVVCGFLSPSVQKSRTEFKGKQMSKAPNNLLLFPLETFRISYLAF